CGSPTETSSVTSARGTRTYATCVTPASSGARPTPTGARPVRGSSSTKACASRRRAAVSCSAPVAAEARAQDASDHQRRNDIAVRGGNGVTAPREHVMTDVEDRFDRDVDRALRGQLVKRLSAFGSGKVAKALELQQDGPE